MSGAEPAFTIYVPAWEVARERVGTVEPEETRAVLCAALDLVESGWPAVRALQLWVEQHREEEGAEDDHGVLLTYVESEVREAFRSMALTLANVAADWPGWERASTDDVDGWMSAFVRYVSVLVLATEGARVPPEFRERVHQVVPLRLGGEWCRQLSGVLEAIRDRSAVAGPVQVPPDQLGRARERMRTLGPRALSAPELVAVVLDGIVPGPGPGLDASRNLLREFSPSDAQALRRIMAARLSTVSGVRGLGEAKAAVLLAGLEIGRRAVEEGRAERDKFTTAAEVFAYLHPSMRDQPHEAFRVLLLDHERGLRRELAVGQHAVTAVGAVNLRDVFRVGLVEGAHGIVLVQSQPSGKPSPSALDRVTTRLFNKGCQTLGFVAYDHIIIGEDGYFSAREAGALPLRGSFAATEGATVTIPAPDDDGGLA